jgi:hypothetical protein
MLKDNKALASVCLEPRSQVTFIASVVKATGQVHICTFIHSGDLKDIKDTSTCM